MTTNQNLFDDSGWQEAPGYPSGTLVKSLLDKNGMKTFVLKIPAGYNMGNHSHLFVEQHVILRGEFILEGKPAVPGTYNCYLPGESHGPFTSETGGMVLVFWYPE